MPRDIDDDPLISHAIARRLGMLGAQAIHEVSRDRNSK
jgi:hypothetical protein